MKALLFLTAIFLAPVVALSQSTEPMKTKALSFGFNGAGSLGGKIWISSQEAVTLRVGATTSSRTSEATDTINIDEESRQLNLNLSAGLERHLALDHGISPYVAGGVTVGYDLYNSKDGTKANPYEYESSSTSLGAYAGVGVEYWVTRRISIAGQQTVTGTYSIGKYSNGSPGTPDDETRSFTIGLGTSSLIASVYF